MSLKASQVTMVWPTILCVLAVLSGCSATFSLTATPAAINLQANGSLEIECRQDLPDDLASTSMIQIQRKLTDDSWQNFAWWQGTTGGSASGLQVSGNGGLPQDTYLKVVVDRATSEYFGDYVCSVMGYLATNAPVVQRSPQISVQEAVTPLSVLILEAEDQLNALRVLYQQDQQAAAQKLDALSLELDSLNQEIDAARNQPNPECVMPDYARRQVGQAIEDKVLPQAEKQAQAQISSGLDACGCSPQ